MNLPTIILSVLVAAVVAAIILRGIYNRRHGKGGCSCGCSSCPSQGMCHPAKVKAKEKV